MDKVLLSNDVVSILRRHLRSRRNPKKRPIFIFSCGGREDRHPARRMLQDFVTRSDDESFRNVFFLKAENLALDPRMEGLNLLAQEAILADVADWLVIFAESVGTFCELGAFASLPHSASITSVVVEKSHQHDNSFLIKGPVTVIKETPSVLSRVFYSNLDCPMANRLFAETVNDIRKRVEENEGRNINKDRKKLNTQEDKINIGSLAHEMLDLITLFGPIDAPSLLSLYCTVKNFDPRKVRIFSAVLQQDMDSDKRIGFDQLLAVLTSMNLIGSQWNEENGIEFFYSKIRLEDFFMFKGTDECDFANMRARVVLKRRKQGRGFEKSLYRRFDPI